MKKKYIVNVSDCPCRSKIRWEMKFLCTVHPCHGLKGPGVCSRPYKGALSTCIQYTHSRTVAPHVINGYLVINGVTLQKQLQGKYLQLIW